MTYAQVAAGQRLHIVYEAGEVYRGQVIPEGCLSSPLCGRRAESYRIVTDAPRAKAKVCRNCLRVYRAARRGEGGWK